MSKWLKQFLFGIWGLLADPTDRASSSKNGWRKTSSPIPAVWPRRSFATLWLRPFLITFAHWASSVGLNLCWCFDGDRTWRLTGMVEPEVGREKASELRSLGAKFRSLSDSLKYGRRRRDGRTMWVISSLQSRPHWAPPGNFICGSRMSTCTNCRMRHSFVNTSDASVSF